MRSTDSAVKYCLVLVAVLWAALMQAALADTSLADTGVANNDQPDSDLADRLARTQWQALRGDAVKVIATPDDVIYALGTDARIYRWRSGRGWLLLPGEFKDLTIDHENKPWAIDLTGTVRRFNGLWWDEKGDSLQASAINASLTSGNVFVLTEEGVLSQWQKDEEAWVEIPLRPGASNVAFAQDTGGNFWTLTDSGVLNLATPTGNTWRVRQIASGVRTIVANPEGGVVAITTDGDANIISAQGGSRTVDFPFPVGVLALSRHQTPWVIDTQNSIYTSSSFMPAVNDADVASTPVQEPSFTESEELKSENARAAASLITNRPINTDLPELRFVKVRDAQLQSVEVSLDGSIYGLTADQTVVRWRNRYKDFSRFPGEGVSLTSDVTGDLWLSNSLDSVYRLDDTRWQEINNISADKVIATSFGEVYAITSSFAVYRFNTVTQRFERLPGITAKDIDTDPDGNVWVLTPKGILTNCSHSPCETLRSPRVDAFDIGPDGGFYIVSDDHTLYRLRTDESNPWQILRRNVSQVSVGPDNYPWVIDTSNNVLYSALFERDESNDTRIALSVTGDTSGRDDGASGISINRAMRFTQATAPQSLTSQSQLISTAAGDLFIAQYTQASSGGSASTYVNTFCLNNPFDQNCGLPDICPDTVTAGCEPCNTAANQAQSALCTEVTTTANVSPGDWLNGYCFALPSDPACSFPSQGTSADQVDCQNPMNQTHTVCVQYQNQISSADTSPLITSLWRYEERLRRFTQVKKLPAQTVAVSAGEEGELWAVDQQEVLYREIRNGVFSRESAYRAGSGDNPVLMAGNSDSVFVLNSSQELFEFSDSGLTNNSVLQVLVKELASDISGRLWAIANGRIVTLEEQGATVESHLLTQASKSLTVTVTGDVYLILGQAIYRLNKTTDRLEKVRGNYEVPQSLAADAHGKLWVITTTGKLLRQI